ncbi:MAG TPA: hypothetical protein VGM14_10195 [Streptosporangiaceae bacterium]|jgi:hypothetical protein
MTVFALLTWVLTVLGGLFLLAIWLIEYDPEFQRAAATRLPVPVISSHAILAICGLAVWVSYLITGQDQFAYATLAILAAVVCLGIMMAVRWLKVYQASEAPPRRAAKAQAVPAAARVGAGGTAHFNGDSSRRHDSTAPVRASSDLLVPPERHFPLSVVIGHGIFAVTTVVLVLLTVFGIGEH